MKGTPSKPPNLGLCKKITVYKGAAPLGGASEGGSLEPTEGVPRGVAPLTPWGVWGEKGEALCSFSFLFLTRELFDYLDKLACT